MYYIVIHIYIEILKTSSEELLHQMGQYLAWIIPRTRIQVCSNKVAEVTNIYALSGHIAKNLLMNHFVIVFNMLSGERIKAHWASC